MECVQNFMNTKVRYLERDEVERYLLEQKEQQ